MAGRCKPEQYNKNTGGDIGLGITDETDGRDAPDYNSLMMWISVISIIISVLALARK